MAQKAVHSFYFFSGLSHHFVFLDFVHGFFFDVVGDLGRDQFLFTDDFVRFCVHFFMERCLEIRLNLGLFQRSFFMVFLYRHKIVPHDRNYS